MAILILFFIFSLTASPALAQLNPDETGCETWNHTVLHDEGNGWVFREANPDTLNQNVGVATPDAQEGEETAWIEREFERKYVVSKVDVIVYLAPDENTTDFLEIRLPRTNVIKRVEALSSYISSPSEEYLVTWEGSIVAESIGIRLQAPTEEFSRAVIYNVTICVEEEIDLRNLAFVIRDLLFNPIVFVVGIVMSFALLMMLLNLLYEQFSR